MPRILGSVSNFSFNFFAIFRVMSFSRLPLAPRAPGSSPPCPASITMVIRRSSSLFMTGISAGAAVGGISTTGSTGTVAGNVVVGTSGSTAIEGSASITGFG